MTVGCQMYYGPEGSPFLIIYHIDSLLIYEYGSISLLILSHEKIGRNSATEKNRKRFKIIARDLKKSQEV